MSKVYIPKNLVLNFPLKICEDCDLCQPNYEPSPPDFYGVEQYDLTCSHLEACKRAYYMEE